MGTYQEYDIKNLTGEELIHMLNQESVHWTINCRLEDTMSGILCSEKSEIQMRNGEPKLDEKGKPFHIFKMLHKNPKGKLKEIKVKIGADSDPLEKIPEGSKILLKNPVYHRGYFEAPDGWIKWENVVAEGVKKV